MWRFTAVTTKALTLTLLISLNPFQNLTPPLPCENLNSSSNLCFGIPIGYFCLQPKCPYIFVSPCITHSIVLSLVSDEHVIFPVVLYGCENRACECCNIWHRAEYLHLRDMKWQNSHSNETHKSVCFTEYIRTIMNNTHYDCYNKLSYANSQRFRKCMHTEHSCGTQAQFTLLSTC